MSNLTLSSLNRSALAAREGYWWINLIAIILSLVIASMSVRAYEAVGAGDKALVCVTCQALAIALAILGRRAMTAQMPWAGLLALAGAAGCAWWAGHGLSLAWARGGDQANEWMVFFLTGLEPALFLLAEHVREGRQTLRKAHEQAEAEQEEELRRIRRREDERERREQGFGRAVSDGLKLVGGTAMAMSAPGAHAQALAPIVSTNPGYASAQEHALALWRANKALTQEQIAAQVGSKRTTVGRWIRAEQTRTEQSAA